MSAHAPAIDPATMLTVDGHVHSTWSDGASTPAENLAAAIAAGLEGMVMVDHVRRTTDWLPAMVRDVDALRASAALDVRIGVETKIMDATGRLDLPTRLDGVQTVLIADHRFPGPGGPIEPAQVTAWLRAGAVSPRHVLEDLVAAMIAALGTVRLPAVLAHPFSLLPKMGLRETDVPPDALLALAARCRETDTAIEINEKWRCPGSPIVELMRVEGVRLVVGSDAHDAPDVGRWSSVRDTLAAVRDEAPSTRSP